MTAVVWTRDQALARRAELLAGCRLSRDELYERADTWTLSTEERNVYETVRTLDWLLRDYDDDWMCDGCTCCTRDGCHRGEGSDCPVGGEGTHWEGESMCPCTGG